MASIKQFLDRANKIRLERVLKDAFITVLPQYVDEIQVQLYHGYDGQGERLRKYANPAYAAKKAGMNPLPGFGNPDLRLTGDFYKGIDTSVNGYSLKTKSSDEKNRMLVKKYGYYIFVPGGKFRASFVKEALQPAFVKEIKKILF